MSSTDDPSGGTGSPRVRTEYSLDGTALDSYEPFDPFEPFEPRGGEFSPLRSFPSGDLATPAPTEAEHDARRAMTRVKRDATRAGTAAGGDQTASP